MLPDQQTARRVRTIRFSLIVPLLRNKISHSKETNDA
jgi:hypothetical protein